MNERERLIELMKEANAETAAKIERGEINDTITGWEWLADYLLSQGVTVHEHGWWEIFLSDYDDCEVMRCSCCGSEFYDGDNDTVDSLHNYCPNCGAKMDGGKEK